MWTFINGLSLVATLACVHSRQTEDNNASTYSRELRTDTYLVDYKGGKAMKVKREKIDKKNKTEKSKTYEELTSSSTESIAPNMIPFPTLSPSIRLTTYIPVGKKKEETESLDDRNTIPKITTPTSPSMSVVSQIEQDSSDNGDIFSRTTIPSAPLISNIPTNENKTDLIFLNISNLTSIPVLTINKTLAPTIVIFAATGSPTFSPTMMIPVTKELTLQPTRSSKSPAFQPSLMPTKHDTKVSTVDTKTLNSTEEAFFITASPSEMCITGTDISEDLGNCLIGRDTAGCDNKKCESIICSDLDDGFCCDTTWDSVCASQAEIYCVLDKLPNSNCYSYSDEGGCDTEGCANEICQYDDHCCTENWDFDCIIQAIQLCCTSYFLR